MILLRKQYRIIENVNIIKLGFQRVDNPLVRSRAESPCRVWDRVPQTAAGRSAKGELKNSPVDCFLRGNALQERAFP